MRDRQARGLESDPREKTNSAPCTVPLYTGPRPATAAGAARIRRESMKLCACRMCALALNPPRTFAEHTRFVGDITPEAREWIYGGAPIISTHHADRATINAYRASNDEEKVRELNHGRDVFGNAVRKAGES